ncbi:hypothetical protein ACFLZH_04370 [Patescibacteria group bacterium]
MSEKKLHYALRDHLLWEAECHRQGNLDLSSSIDIKFAQYAGIAQAVALSLPFDEDEEVRCINAHQKEILTLAMSRTTKKIGNDVEIDISYSTKIDDMVPHRDILHIAAAINSLAVEKCCGNCSSTICKHREDDVLDLPPAERPKGFFRRILGKS